MNRHVLSIGALLASLALAWPGFGALGDGDDGCPCDAAESLEADHEADASSGAGAALPDELVDVLVDEEDHDSCPPGCDDCACCGVATMIATESGAVLRALGAIALAPRIDASAGAPLGERSGVFRPPRA